MTAVVFILLAAATSLFIAQPILQARSQRGRLHSNSSDHRLQELEEQKASVYSAIKDIEFDYRMGKLSKEDFEALRQQYKAEAVELLKKIDRIRSEKAGSQRIFSRKKAGADATAGATQYCWMCGTAVTQSDRFCANCGNKLLD